MDYSTKVWNRSVLFLFLGILNEKQKGIQPMNIKKLKENQYIKFIPQINTIPWTVELDENNEPYFPYTETQVYTDIHVDVLLCDYKTDGDYIEKIGYADIAVINSHVFERTTFMHIDCDDGHLSRILEEMAFYNHEDNYMVFGLSMEYEPFMILRNIHIDKEYRRMGIGKAIIQFAHEYIGAILNLNLNSIVWEVSFFDKTIDDEPFTEKDFDNLIAFSKAIGGHEFSNPIFELKYFFYNNNPFSIDEKLLEEFLKESRM